MKPEEISATFSPERIDQDASGQTPYTLNRILAEIALQLATINEKFASVPETVDAVTEVPTEEPHKQRGRPPMNRKEDSHA